MARPMVRFFIQSTAGTLEAAAKQNARLLTVLLKQGIASEEMFECSGKLQCGKCVVRVDPALAGVADTTELQLLSAKGCGGEGYRCSCQLRIGDEFRDQVVQLLT